MIIKTIKNHQNHKKLTRPKRDFYFVYGAGKYIQRFYGTARSGRRGDGNQNLFPSHSLMFVQIVVIISHKKMLNAKTDVLADHERGSGR